MDAFDADVLIYAAAPGHPLGDPVRAIFEAIRSGPVGVGSMLLVPEVLTRPSRAKHDDEIDALKRLLSRLDLHELDQATATLAAGLAAEYRLRLADAVHLATAVQVGATRFVTANRQAFGDRIVEIDIVHPDAL